MDEFNNNNKKEDLGGYTVTPNGGYYNGETIYNAEPVNLDPTPINVVKETSANDIDAAFVGSTPPRFTPPKKQKPKFSLLTVIISVVLSIVAGTASGFGVYVALNQPTANGEDNFIYKEKDNITNTTINVSENATNLVEAVTTKAGPSVVGIGVTSNSSSFFADSSSGSGIIYSQDGYIITNYHVISSAVNNKKTVISVYLSSDPETPVTASVIGYNIASDLAVIKIQKTGLPEIELGDSDELKVGQYAIAIGSPGGMEFMNSVSFGIISGLNRSLSTGTGNATKLIQTDAAINPGNSGGALLNANGQLIGINSSKLVDTSFEGMGFAIPVNHAKEICDKIINNQGEDTAYVGIEINTQYTPEILEYLGYPKGAVVNSVVEDSPADEAGIERGDIITSFNGKTISSYSDLETAIAECKVGEKVSVKLYRAGRFYTTTIEVESNNA